jgi:RNA polymerase sigma-70 factor (ECF subfamily)
VDTASPKPAELVLPVGAEQPSTLPAIPISGLPPGVLEELWRTAEAEACGLTPAEFGAVLAVAGEKVNYGLAAGGVADGAQKVAFFRALHLAELALAHACALGREAAWETFLRRYRAQLIQAASAITGSATLGQELADSLYAELYGLRLAGEERRSPLASYSGRGSLMGWLRTTLAQRFRDHHRRTWREASLDGVDDAASEPAAAAPAGLSQLAAAVARTLRGLPAEDRFLLSAYFLDRQTLLQVAQLLRVHEATVSRRIKRLGEAVRKQLLHNLAAGGMSKSAAEEALGADPRDIEINLRAVLQTSQSSAFSNQTAPNAASEPL